METMLQDSLSRPHGTVTISLDADTYDRLCYVADYFEWSIRKVVVNVLIRSLSGVKFGEELKFSDWSDPHRLKK